MTRVVQGYRCSQAVVPSLNVTVPVGTVELEGTVATAAVNVTERPPDRIDIRR
jgi:hypothetical protein